MLDTGLRLSEAINLQWKGIDLNSGKAKEHRSSSSFLVFLVSDRYAVIDYSKQLLVANTNNRDLKT
jgi:integrase